MKRWEYKIVYVMPPYDLSSLAALNELGAQGWEVVSVYAYSEVAENGVAVLKRELEAFSIPP